MAEFINPYTFVPIEQKNPERKAQEYGTLSGVIKCKMTVKTPIFIPNTTKMFPDVQVPDHKHKLFYSYADLSKANSWEQAKNMVGEPVIPGSEIRGMVRNVYEQLTNSCFLHIDEFNLPYKRTIEPKKMCLMIWNSQKNVWELFDSFESYSGAVRYDTIGNTYYLSSGWEGYDEIEYEFSETMRDFDYGRNNRISYNDNSKNISINDRGRYYIHFAPLMTGKTKNGEPTANRSVIYSLNTQGNGVALSKENIQRFENVLGITENVKGGYITDINQNADSKLIHQVYVERYKKHQPLIVYVDKDSYDNHFRNQKYYLSPSSMTKEFFENTIDKLLEKNYHHQPCKVKSSVCPACRLFGMVGDDGAVSGKLKFEDAYVKGNYQFGEEKTLPILGSPRISSTEFYLQKTDNVPFWNYDYNLTYEKVKGEFKFHRKPYDAVLSGRKVYWNRRVSNERAEKTKMNCSVTPLNEGSFTFDIHFDKLTETELESLLFCLKLDGKAFHKIGGGKPIGYGKVALTVENVEVTSYSMVDGKVVKVRDQYHINQALATQIATSNAANLILKYSTDLSPELMALIDYPRCADSNDIFKWFGKNRGSVSNPGIVSTLPKLSDSMANQTLPKHYVKPRF